MAANPFRVHVASIFRTAEPRHERRRGEIHDLFVSASEVPPGSEVEVEVTLSPVGHSLEAVGTVRTSWAGECRRCLRPVRGALEAQVHEVFEPDHVEGESYPLRNDEVDLEPMAREAVVLELPQVPLCREDCLGLCPHCGADLNEGNCSCAPPADARWAVLDELRDT